MTAVRSNSKRSLAFITALATLFALALPFMADPANAATVDNSCELDVLLDTASNATGVTHTLTATVEDSNGGACDDAAGYEVDFEIESGPAARVNVTGDAGAGGTASDDGNTPLSPDLTCTAPDVGPPSTCTATFTSDTAGTHVVRAWLDDDKNNATFDADATEGRNPGTAVPAGGDADDLASATTPTPAPGDRSEADDTDVVDKTWFAALSATASLDCTPELATNPSTGTDSTETYTCTLFNDNGAGGGTASNGIKDGTEAGIAGVKIDGENQNGANDPDNAASLNATADYNDGGTTDVNGVATLSIAASEAQAGEGTLICFWADNDNDTSAAGTDGQIDGSDCAAEGQAVVDSDITDVVSKTWRGTGVAFSISVTPASDQNLKGATHTVVAKVTDFGGLAVPGAFVDIDIVGRNAVAGPNLDQALTNAQGEVTFTYTDVNTGTPNGEQDTINAYVDSNDDDAADANAAATPMTAQAVKFWFTTEPTAASVSLDMIPAAPTNTCADTTAGATATHQAADVALVGVFNPICASAYASDGTDILGETVTFTISGTGAQFAIDADADGVLDAGEELGATTTITTDAEGDAEVSIFSNTAGAFTVTASADGQTSTGTKTYTPEAARTLDCEPETGSNDPGTDHVVTCTARDRFGNPTNDVDGDSVYGEPGVGGDTVNFTETGTGRIESATNVTLNAAGQAEAVAGTTENETGAQTITGELDNDTGDVDGAADLDDPCDQGVGNLSTEEGDGSDVDSDAIPAAEAPAGVCEDTVDKDWEVQPVTECDDGIDNDFDGDIDFPADNGCDSLEDDDESDEPITETDHDVSVSIDKFKKVKLGGGKKSLKVKGSVTSDFEPCFNQTFVKLQLRAGGSWVTRKSDVTNDSGKWSVLIRHIKGKYRAVVPKFSIFEEDTIDNCLRAFDVRRYGKKKNN